MPHARHKGDDDSGVGKFVADPAVATRRWSLNTSLIRPPSCSWNTPEPWGGDAVVNAAWNADRLFFANRSDFVAGGCDQRQIHPSRAPASNSSGVYQPKTPANFHSWSSLHPRGGLRILVVFDFLQLSKQVQWLPTCQKFQF